MGLVTVMDIVVTHSYSASRLDVLSLLIVCRAERGTQLKDCGLGD
jgi:hypothetical protein